MQNGVCHNGVANGHVAHMENGLLPHYNAALKQPISSHGKKTKTLMSFACLLLATLLNNIALAWIHERVPTGQPPLPDIWFSLFPEWTGAIQIAEALIMLAVFLTFGVLLMHQHRWIVLRRVFLIAAVCYVGRALCITVTQVPVPSRKTFCGPKENVTTLDVVARRVMQTILSLGIDSVNPRVLCGDLIYSGHTITLTVAALAVNQYSPRKYRLLGVVSWTVAIVGMMCILMARKHYTIDIILAYYVTTRVFWIYHSLVERNYYFGSAKRGSGGGVLGNVYWYALFNYFECDINVPVANNFVKLF